MVQKILVLRFSSIGDIVLTSPVVRCIKEQTQADVHFLCKVKFHSLLSNNPHLDKVITFEKDIHEVMPTLRAEKYDYIIDLHHNLRSARLKWKLGVKSYSFPKLNIRKWLYVRLKWNKMPAIHVVDRYFEAVQFLGVKNDRKGLDFFISAHDEVSIASYLPPHFQSYIAIALGAQFATKRLPIEQLKKLVTGIQFPIVLLGGKEDEATGNELAALSPTQIFNAAGRLTLQQSASIIRQSTLVIAHDTGLMHIASAFNKTIFSIWGNTTPALGMAPYLPHANNRIFEVKHLSCRPCSKIGYQKCPKGHFKCMMQHNITEIAQATNEFSTK